MLCEFPVEMITMRCPFLFALPKANLQPNSAFWFRLLPMSFMAITRDQITMTPGRSAFWIGTLTHIIQQVLKPMDYRRITTTRMAAEYVMPHISGRYLI